MQVSKNGVALIEKFEGFVPNAYKDPGSKNGLPITIGYGSTMYQDGSKIKMGDKITKEAAQELLMWEVNNKTGAINGALKGVPVNQNQFDSLCSFVYNLGMGAFNGSTLLKKVKLNPNDPSIKNEFLKWVNNDGKPMKGLIARRNEESKLYFTPIK
jgi:lysozyme